MIYLDAEVIEHGLRDRGLLFGLPIQVKSLTESTNTDARNAALDGAVHGSSFLAEEQTQGRGRGSHLWHSPFGENIYLSIVLRPKRSIQSMLQLPLVIGLCLAECLEGFLPVSKYSVQVKWPNDIFVENKKVAGILVEAQAKTGSSSVIILGIGINVLTQEFPEELEHLATSFSILGCLENDRNQIIVEILRSIGLAYEQFESGMLNLDPEEFSKRDFLKDKEVQVGAVQGIPLGIDLEGRLRIRDTSGKNHFILSGEVKWRK